VISVPSVAKKFLTPPGLSLIKGRAGGVIKDSLWPI